MSAVASGVKRGMAPTRRPPTDSAPPAPAVKGRPGQGHVKLASRPPNGVVGDAAGEAISLLLPIVRVARDLVAIADMQDGYRGRGARAARGRGTTPRVVDAVLARPTRSCAPRIRRTTHGSPRCRAAAGRDGLDETLSDLRPLAQRFEAVGASPEDAVHLVCDHAPGTGLRSRPSAGTRTSRTGPSRPTYALAGAGSRRSRSTKRV
jgi:hypothetical protein